MSGTRWRIHESPQLSNLVFTLPHELSLMYCSFIKLIGLISLTIGYKILLNNFSQNRQRFNRKRKQKQQRQRHRLLLLQRHRQLRLLRLFLRQHLIQMLISSWASGPLVTRSSKLSTSKTSRLKTCIKHTWKCFRIDQTQGLKIISDKLGSSTTRKEEWIATIPAMRSSCVPWSTSLGMFDYQALLKYIKSFESVNIKLCHSSMSKYVLLWLLAL